MKLSKCRFAYRRIDLGYSVTEEGIRPNDGHVEAIKKLAYPTDAKGLQRILGLFSYMRMFIRSFSEIAKPLRMQLAKEARFDFNHECEQAFDNLKNRLVHGPVLAIFNPSREIELHCDASALGFGTALMQKQEDGHFHPVSFFSQAATPAESRYHSFELESLAIVYALRRYRVYLEGRKLGIQIVTDCNSLKLTLEKKQMNARISRWALELQEYDYTLQHRPGTSMAHVDALSRCHKLPEHPCSPCDKLNTDTMNESAPAAIECRVIAAVNEVENSFHIQVTQCRDPAIINLRSKLEAGPVDGYKMMDGLVFRESGKGQNCIQCIMYAAPVRPSERNLYCIKKEPVPFNTLHLDHFGPLPSLNSKRKHILSTMDAFSKLCKLYAVNSTSTKEVLACLEKYFEYYGRPRRIITDQATCFTSFEFTKKMMDWNIEHVKVAVGSPQANGQVERLHRTIKAMLGKLIEPISHADWVQELAHTEYAINNSKHRVTGFSPCELAFGLNQRGKTPDRLTEFIENEYHSPPARELNHIREVAVESINKSQRYLESYVNEKGKPAKTYAVGDLVVITNVDVSVGTNKKFVPHFRGPFVVHQVLKNDRYVIRDVENGQLTQRPYNNIIEAARLRLWVGKKSGEVETVRREHDTVDCVIGSILKSDLAEL